MTTIKIKVQFFGQLRRSASADSETVEAPDTASAVDVLRLLAERHDVDFGRIVFSEDGALRPSLLALVNDEALDPDALSPLREGDHITLLPAISGG